MSVNASTKLLAAGRLPHEFCPLTPRVTFRIARFAAALLSAVLMLCGRVLSAQSAIPLPAEASFGSVQVGATSPLQTVTFTFTASATLGSTPYGVFTQGTQALDFRPSPSQLGSACTASHTYSLGNTCTVQVSFSPGRPGLSLGAVQLLDSSLAQVGTATFSGTGSGPMLTFPSVTRTTFYKGNPVHVAVDRAGDVFVAESTSTSGNGVVKFFPATQGVVPSAGNPITLASNFGTITGLAVDGTGDVFVVDNGTGSVKEIVAVEGSYTTNPDVILVYSGTPRSVAFDAAGNLLVTDATSVKRLAPVNGIISTTSPVTTITTGLSNPSGLAVSPAGDVYVSDTGNDAVKQIVATGGTVSPLSTVTSIYPASGSAPRDLAVDAAGDLYIAVYGYNRTLEVVAVNGALPASPNFLLVGGYGTFYPTGVAVSSRGDVFFVDDHANTVYKLDQGDPPNLTFASSKPPATSSDSPQTLTLANAGNAPLVFSVPATGTNPSTPGDFTLSGSTACPVLNTASTAAMTLIPGAQCTQSVSFKPVVTGPIAEVTTFTDNSLNVAAATQAVPLSGFGLGNLAIAALNPPLFSGSTTYVGSTYNGSAGAYIYNLTANAIQFTESLSDPTNFSVNLNCPTGSIAANATCGVQFQFHPTAVGTFTATYTVTDPTVPNAPVSVTFSAVAVADPVDSTGNYTVQVVPISDGNPYSIAVGPKNDVYVSVLVPNQGYFLDELPSANGVENLNQQAQRVATGTLVPQGQLRTDDQGNVYFIGNNSAGYELSELLAVNGTLPVNPVAQTLYQVVPTGNSQNTSYLGGPLAVDHQGNVFFESFYSGYPTSYEYLNELVAVAGAVLPVNPTIRTLRTDATPSGQTGNDFEPQTLGTDSANNLYYVSEADVLNELATVNGTIPNNPQNQILPGSAGDEDRYSGPFAIDANGDVIYSYVDDSTGAYVSQILKLTAVNGVLPAYPEVQILYSEPAASLRPSGIAIDSAGDILVTDVFGNRIIRLTLGAAPAGSLSIAPTTQNFPSAAIGTTSAAQTSIISNTTSNAIYLSAGSLTDGTDFTQSDNCNGLLAAGGTCTVSFTFTPKSTGPLTSTYAIHDLNNPGTTLNVVLSGTATAAPTPQASLSPASFNYGSITTGTVSATQTFVLSNTGTVPLPIGSVGLGGANSGAYAITSSTCSGTIAAGSGCSVSVTFNPVATGTFNATLSIVDTAGTQTSTLSGTATVAPAPQATLTPATMNYGSITAGTISTAQTFTLTNAGNASLAVTSAMLTGANPTAFAITSNTCAGTLAAGASCTIVITFNPSAAGTFNATLTVVDAVGTQASALTGTATAVVVTAPQAVLTPATINYGNITAGASSSPQTFTVTNAGNAALTITSVSLGGANASSFAIAAKTCGGSLAAGANCTVSISFNPTSAGSFSATLLVADAVGTQTSALSGSATSVGSADFALTATPASQSSYRGRSVTYALQLTSLVAANPFTGVATLSATNLPAGATVSFSPPSVVPGVAQPAASTMTITVPALVSMRSKPISSPFAPQGITLAMGVFGLLFYRVRKRRLSHLLSIAFLLGLAVSITGCGTGNGFAVPTSTTSITVTATSGLTVHSTTVALTIQ